MRSIFFISLVLTPLLYYQSKTFFIYPLALLSILFFVLYKKFLKTSIMVVWLIFLFIGNLYVSEVINFPFDIQESQLIFNSPEINYHIKRHQEDALYLPYKIRQLVYSSPVFFYASISNFFDLITIKNISDILLLANVYPLFLGLYEITSERNRLRNFILLSFLITLITTGIDRSADKFQSLYLLFPMFIYLIFLGYKKVDKKLYISLFILSIFILISPKI